jgi:hypothetical protein
VAVAGTSIMPLSRFPDLARVWILPAVPHTGGLAAAATCGGRFFQ